jgi:hypothetical protein
MQLFVPYSIISFVLGPDYALCRWMAFGQAVIVTGSASTVAGGMKWQTQFLQLCIISCASKERGIERGCQGRLQCPPFTAEPLPLGTTAECSSDSTREGGWGEPGRAVRVSDTVPILSA